MTDGTGPRTDDSRPGVPPVDEGGESACSLPLVCPACGRIPDAGAADGVCPECGTDVRPG